MKEGLTPPFPGSRSSLRSLLAPKSTDPKRKGTNDDTCNYCQMCYNYIASTYVFVYVPVDLVMYDSPIII